MSLCRAWRHDVCTEPGDCNCWCHNATSAPSGDAQGERAHGDGTAAQGSAETNSGGKR